MRGPSRGFQQDLHNIFLEGPLYKTEISLGSPQGLQIRICAKSCKDLLETDLFNIMQEPRRHNFINILLEGSIQNYATTS